MAGRKPDEGGHSLKGTVVHLCKTCGKVAVVGALYCATCLGAGPAQAAPQPPEPHPVVQVSPAPQFEPVLRYYTISELEARGWHGLPPVSPPDDNDLPEPDATFYEGGVFAGTAVTGTATRLEPGGFVTGYL